MERFLDRGVNYRGVFYISALNGGGGGGGVVRWVFTRSWVFY